MSRKNFQRLPDISEQHNEIHRKAYATPYLHKILSTYPARDDMDVGEKVLCINSTLSAICYKINDSTILSAGLS